MSLAKILVVDDEVEIVRAVSMRLKAAGYEVIIAHDGVTATQMAFRESPDVVILDIGLPDLNGHEVAQSLFTDTESLSTPIIYLTARIAVEDRTRAYKTGAIAYLTKPFRACELLAAVSRAETASRQMRCANSERH